MSLSVNFRGIPNNVAAPTVEPQNEVEPNKKSLNKKTKTALLCSSLAALAAAGAYMVIRKKPAPVKTPTFFERCKMVDGKLISPYGEPYSGAFLDGNYYRAYDEGKLLWVQNIKDTTQRGMCFDKHGNKLITKRNYKNNIETNVVIKRRENGTLEYCEVRRRDISNKDRWVSSFEKNHLGDGYRATYDETGKLTSKEFISYADDLANMMSGKSWNPLNVGRLKSSSGMA